MDKDLDALAGIIFDDEEVSLAEVCRCCSITAEGIIEMIDEGLVEPLGGEPVAWRFSARDLRRIKVAIRLQQDLRVNLAGAALALELLEELHDLRRRLRG